MLIGGVLRSGWVNTRQSVNRKHGSEHDDDFDRKARDQVALNRAILVGGSYSHHSSSKHKEFSGNLYPLERPGAVGAPCPVTRARKMAQNYLLKRRMFRSLRTGELGPARAYGWGQKVAANLPFAAERMLRSFVYGRMLESTACGSAVVYIRLSLLWITLPCQRSRHRANLRVSSISGSPQA